MAITDTVPLRPFHACLSCGGDKAWQEVLLSQDTVQRDEEGHQYNKVGDGRWKDLIDNAKKHTMALDDEMRHLSTSIHQRPELGFEEHFAHDILTSYMEKKSGWKVKRQVCGLKTAWLAEWTSTHGDGLTGVRAIGFNSEMDALPSIGHACGHNLIAVAGVSAAIGTAEAINEAGIPGRVILLGTPAEEGGGGKAIMLEKGAYDGMDACLMTHPAPFDGVGSCLAVKRLRVTFRGKTAHAAATPWAGHNALDAAVLAYNGISVLRQQTEDMIRIQGIIQPEPTWAQNVIPDVANMHYGIRAPTIKQVDYYMSRVIDCFEGAAKSTRCTVEINIEDIAYEEIIVNNPLSEVYKSFMTRSCGKVFKSSTSMLGSTDFGNVTKRLPGLHPIYSIPLPDPQADANHTVGFTAAAITPQAHAETMRSAMGLSVTAALFLADESFAQNVQKDFEVSKRSS